MGFSQFKIEGRGLGSALILEFLLYYMTKPGYQPARQGKNLSGQYAGSVLSGSNGRQTGNGTVFKKTVLFLREDVKMIR